MSYEFGTKLRLKKDWRLNSLTTFGKGEIVKVAYQDHKYGIDLVHPQIRGAFSFAYYPENKEKLLTEYFEVVETPQEVKEHIRQAAITLDMLSV